MTIKKRLFLSNILMVIIPVLLGVAVASMVMYMIRGMFNIRDGRKFEDGDHFQKVVIQVKEETERWTGMENKEEIIANLNLIAEKAGRENITLAVYRHGEILHTTGAPYRGPIMDTVLAQQGEHFFTMDSAHIFSKNLGEFTVVVTDISFFGDKPNFVEFRQYLYNLQALLFLFMLGIVLLTNLLLTRMVYKSIMVPLDTLIYGVHQLRDGNLKYRIKYAREDEFNSACSDFNEMAGRFLDMVNARQRDDENRRELIAGISHDLRTPLTSIKAYTEGLEKGVASNPEVQRKYLETIKRKTDDLDHIVSQLFLFSKLDVGAFPFHHEILNVKNELGDMFSSAYDEYKEKGLELRIAQDGPEAFIKADRVQMKNVIDNILSNSLKYGHQENKVLTVSWEERDSRVIITATDNGPGVPEDTLDKIFNVFYRNDTARSNPGQGSGLGLAISAKIIKRLGGTIRAENSPQGGLSIILDLPAVPSPEGQLGKHETHIDH